MVRFFATKTIAIGLMATLFTSSCLADWTPPAKPNPYAILQEARADYRAKRNDEALGKYVWFHNNVLAIDDAFRGVRLSFALADWKKLADVYPPAMAAFVDTRNQAEAQLARATSAVGTTGAKPLPMQAFIDATAMNEYLQADKRNVAMFKTVTQQYPNEAKPAYARAEKSLIKTQSYALCNPYLDPVDDYAKYLGHYRDDVARAQAKTSKRADDNDLPARSFGNNISNLVALLVHNSRSVEATDVANKAKADVKNADVQTMINAALKGQFPAEPAESGATVTVYRFLERLFRF